MDLFIKNNKKLLTYSLILFTVLMYVYLGLFSFSRGNFLSENVESMSLNRFILLKTLFLGIILCWLALTAIKPTLNKNLKIIIFIIFLAGLITPPFLARDIPGYSLNAEIVYSQGRNPYITPLLVAHVPPEMKDLWWVKAPSPYGPIFLLIIFIPWIFSFSSLLAFIFTYKLITLATFILSFWLFSKIRQRENGPPYLDALFLLNPALIINLIIEGHNETFLIFFLLLFIYFKDSVTKNFSSLVASIFVKFTTLLVWPLAWFKAGKINLKLFITSNLFLLAICLLFFKIINLPALIFLKQNIFFAFNNCFYVCPPFYLVTNFLPENIVNYLKIILFGLAYLLTIFLFLFKKYEPIKFIFWSFLALFFIQTKWLTPWYPTLIIPFGLLINNKKYSILTVLITIYCLLHYFPPF